MLSKMTSKCILALMVLPAMAFAGETYDSNIIGISGDGKVMAFQQSTVQDGSGMATSSIIFVDTTKNAYAAKSVLAVESEINATGNIKAIKKQALKDASGTLKKLNIELGSKLDAAKLRLIYSSSNLLNEDLKSLSFINRGLYWGRHGFGASQHEIVIEQSAAPGGGGSWGDEQLLTVKLKSKLRDNVEKVSILQQDTKLPASRSGAYNYSIAQVYLLDPSSKDEDSSVNVTTGRVVIVLNVFSHGFEGATIDKMVVTGYLGLK